MFELEKDFTTIALENIAIIIRGVTYDKSFESNIKTNNAILTADNISLDGNLEIKKIIYVSDELNFDTQKKLRKNDIFICLSSGSIKHIGKTALINNDTNFYAGGFMGIIRTMEKVNAVYLYYSLNTIESKNYFKSNANGTNIKNLSNSILNMQIAIPPIELQEKFADFVRESDNKKAAALSKKQSLIKEREQIVNKYFR